MNKWLIVSKLHYTLLIITLVTVCLVGSKVL